MADKMNDYVSIETPSGLSWIVAVGKKTNGNFFLHGLGCSDFRDHHKLDLGSVLIFECQRPTKLSVTIFDETDLEITYPSCGRKEKDNEKANRAIANDDVVYKPELFE
ncbi:hypothetical protein ACFE04_002739 [Oxalis oulophora]